MKSPPLMRLTRAYALALLLTLVARRSALTRRTPIALAMDFLPLAFAPLPATLVTASARRDRPLQAATAALIASFHVLYGRRLFRRAPVEQGRELKVLTVNLLSEADSARRVGRLVLEEIPDAVALQELEPPAYAHLAGALAAAYPYHVAYPAPGFRGLGWWSRYPLREREMIWNSEGESLALAVDMRLSDGTIRLVNAHPHTPAIGPINAGLWLYDSGRRDREIRPVLDLVRTLPHPLVLAGDFNMTEQSASYADVTCSLRDAFAACGQGFGHTYPAVIPTETRTYRFPMPLLRLDYVFHSPDLLPRTARVLRHVGSDHLPLAVAFAWPELG